MIIRMVRTIPIMLNIWLTRRMYTTIL